MLFLYIELLALQKSKQIIYHLKTKASNKAEQTINENSIRGNILDRKGNILAINLIHKKINLDPMIIQDEYIEPLAEALLIPIEEFREAIVNKRANNRKYYIAKEKLKSYRPNSQKYCKIKTKKTMVKRL